MHVAPCMSDRCMNEAPPATLIPQRGPQGTAVRCKAFRMEPGDAWANKTPFPSTKNPGQRTAAGGRAIPPAEDLYAQALTPKLRTMTSWAATQAANLPPVCPTETKSKIKIAGGWLFALGPLSSPQPLPQTAGTVMGRSCIPHPWACGSCEAWRSELML